MQCRANAWNRARRVGLAGINEIEAVMGHAALRCGKLARADVHAPVDLHGIGAHHFPAEALGDDLAASVLPEAVGPTMAMTGAESSSMDDRAHERYQVRASSMVTGTMRPTKDAASAPAGTGA